MRKKEREPAAQPPEEVLADALVKLKHIAGRYGPHIVAGVAAIVVALFVLHSYQNKSRREEARAWQELGQMPPLSRLDRQTASDKDLQGVISACEKMLKERWKTPAAAWVLLRLANAQRAAGNPEAALSTYQRLRQDYPEHYATNLAAASRAGALEDAGRYKEAAAAYEEIARGRAEDAHFWLDAGRCWELAGDKEAATQDYQRLAESAREDQSDASELAATRLAELARGETLLSPPPPPKPEPPKETKGEQGGAPGTAEPSAGGMQTPQQSQEPTPSDQEQQKAAPAPEKPKDCP